MKVKDIKMLCCMIPNKSSGRDYLKGVYFTGKKCYATDSTVLIKYDLDDDVNGKYFIDGEVLSRFNDGEIIFKEGKIFISDDGIEIEIKNDEEKVKTYPNVENYLNENKDKKYMIEMYITNLEKIVKFAKKFGCKTVEFYFDDNSKVGKMVFDNYNKKVEGLFTFSEFKKGGEKV